MGVFSTGVIVKGPTQEDLLWYLTQRGRVASVAETVDGITAFYDRDCGFVFAMRFEIPMAYERGKQGWEPLIAELSRDFHCPALVWEFYDGDVYYYQLYVAGKLVDEYASDIDYFGTVRSGELVLDTGELLWNDHAAALCSAFARPEASAAVTQILARAQRPDGQHRDLTAALGFQGYARAVYYGIFVSTPLPPEIRSTVDESVWNEVPADRRSFSAGTTDA